MPYDSEDQPDLVLERASLNEMRCLARELSERGLHDQVYELVTEIFMIAFERGEYDWTKR
ncbi:MULTISPECIES: hypothetical protein [Methylobacterium]|jgi:hypothetical protein|nr:MULTISPECIES: hypothetical protein [Methylobacterium]GBU18041.1 hypothetical protein AwMethylo_22560 [Methylobacterium sp.]